ncbi:hypothetical protein Pcinc_009971 [Petrolisthes cinctipes]|uniref:Sialin n=1 Tax=Petrolisthes cinctipes TaxID=88211 RepID=A0AAE1G5W5_PETCI|nr:hypothetical protein Pcinc_009971 [Petrolisthes cinctipes]
MQEDQALLVPPTPKPPPQPQEFIGTRHVLAFMGFLGFANVYAMRVNLSVAIVAMVNNTAIPHVNSSSSNVCPASSAGNTTHSTEDGEFPWDEKKQGLILGSFFYGYVVSNLFGGRLGEVVGGKVVYGIGVLVTSVLTLFTPVVVRYSTTLFIILRVIEGLGEGVTFPAMHSMMARWIPPLERSKTSGIVYAGAQFGTVVSLPISGLLCQSSFLGGWPSVFYVFGVLGILWFVAWMLLVHNTPESHPRISQEEKDYIHTTLNYQPGQPKALPIPWRHILTSMPFWAIFVVHIGQNWGFYTLLTELPTYMKNILHFDIAANSFMSALPYLMMWVLSIAFGQLADLLRSRGSLSTTNTRRLFNSIGHYGPMVCLVLVGFAGCNHVAAIVFLCGAVGLNGGTYSGYMNSHLDIAPNFAGTLMGITNSFATIPGFLAPIATGALINDNETLSRWRLVFWISSIVYLVSNTFYIIFVSGEEQHWNRPQNKYLGEVQSQYGTLDFSSAETDGRNSEGGLVSQEQGGGPSQPTTIHEVF